MPCWVFITFSWVALMKDTLDLRMCAIHIGLKTPQLPSTCDHLVCLLFIKMSPRFCQDWLPEP